MGTVLRHDIFLKDQSCIFRAEYEIQSEKERLKKINDEIKSHIIHCTVSCAHTQYLNALLTETDYNGGEMKWNVHKSLLSTKGYFYASAEPFK